MPKVKVNGRIQKAEGGVTVADLLEQAGYARQRAIVELNGDPLPRDELESTQLEEGDRLEVVQLVGGG